MLKVAFIVQRCGIEVNGGAELHCLKIAQRMSKYWEVEILTTCALDYLTWDNYYPPGVTEIAGIKTRRFLVSPTRDLDKFNQLSEELRCRFLELSLEEEENWLKAQGPLSPDLITYVWQQQDQYDAFIFFTYLYATTYFILPLVAHKAYLLPLAHDEWCIYLSLWQGLFAFPRGFIFNTPQEKTFLETLFPHIQWSGFIAGLAVDPPSSYNSANFPIKGSFALYIGRIDSAKGCEELFKYFLAYKQNSSSARKLVLLGKSAISIPQHPDLIYLGFVDEQTKWNAIAACDLLIMPSAYESLSLVLLEAWMLGKAVLVNAECEVLLQQCRRSGGGLWYSNQDEFTTILETVPQAVFDQLGQQGKEFVQANYQWLEIEQKYLRLLNDHQSPRQ